MIIYFLKLTVWSLTFLILLTHFFLIWVTSRNFFSFFLYFFYISLKFNMILLRFRNIILLFKVLHKIVLFYMRLLNLLMRFVLLLHVIQNGTSFSWGNFVGAYLYKIFLIKTLFERYSIILIHIALFTKFAFIFFLNLIIVLLIFILIIWITILRLVILWFSYFFNTLTQWWIVTIWFLLFILLHFLLILLPLLLILPFSLKVLFVMFR